MRLPRWDFGLDHQHRSQHNCLLALRLVRTSLDYLVQIPQRGLEVRRLEVVPGIGDPRVTLRSGRRTWSTRKEVGKLRLQPKLATDGAA